MCPTKQGMCDYAEIQLVKTTVPPPPAQQMQFSTGILSW